jgi:hypothetical protein
VSHNRQASPPSAHILPNEPQNRHRHRAMSSYVLFFHRYSSCPPHPYYCAEAGGRWWIWRLVRSWVVTDLVAPPLACGDRRWQRVTMDLESWRCEGSGDMKHMEAGGMRWPSKLHAGGLTASSNTIARRPPPTSMATRWPKDSDGFLNKWQQQWRRHH